MGRAHVPVDELSASEEQRLLFALAFWRLELRRSVVIVDAPELHIQPSDHAELLRTLVSLGDDNQIIVATDSERIVVEATSGQIVKLPDPRAPRTSG